MEDLQPFIPGLETFRSSSSETSGREFLGKSVLESVQLIVQNNRQIQRVFFYTWPWTQESYTDSHTIPGSETILFMPKNQNNQVVGLSRDELFDGTRTDTFIASLPRDHTASISSRVELTDGRERYSQRKTEWHILLKSNFHT
ncbi:MAG: hypothetical protein ACR2LN_04425, partial [Candidatus Levyibacteriota bacterium]